MIDEFFECIECGAPSPPMATYGCPVCGGQGDIVPKGTREKMLGHAVNEIRASLAIEDRGLGRYTVHISDQARLVRALQSAPTEARA